MKRFLHSQWLPRSAFVLVLLTNLVGVIDISWYVALAPLWSIPVWFALVLAGTIALVLLMEVSQDLKYAIEHGSFKTLFKFVLSKVVGIRFNPFKLAKSFFVGVFRISKLILTGK